MNWFTKKTKPDEADDGELLKNYSSTGDIEILGRLFNKYTPLIYGVCLKYLQDEERSKDAVMQIFEELTDKARKPGINNFRSWVYVVSRNYCLMQIRAQSKFRPVNLDDVAESAFVRMPENEGNEAYLKALENCMQKLNVGQQHAIRLFYFDERSYKEIAEATGYTVNEVKSFIQNGKRNLKICLEKNGEF